MLRLFGHNSSLKWLLCGFGILAAFLAGLSLFWMDSLVPLVLLSCAFLGGLILLRKPIYGLYAVLVQLAFIGDSAGVTLLEMIAFVLLLIVLGQAMLSLARAPDLWQRGRPWLTPLLVFLGWCVLNVAIALLEGVLLQSWLREFFPLLNYGLMLVAYIRIRNREDFKTLTVIVVGIVFLVATRDFLYSLRFALGMPVLPNLYAFLVNLLSTRGGVLFALLPVVMGVTLLYQSRHMLMWIVSISLIVTGGTVTLLGGTRTAWVGTLVALVVWTLLRVRKPGKIRLQSLIATGVSVALLLVLLALVSSGMGLGGGFLRRVPLARGVSLGDRVSMMSPEVLARDWSVIGRMNEIEAALREFLYSPLLGRGLGYQLTSLAHPWEARMMTRGYLHNAFVWMLLKLGIIGVALFAWLMVALGSRLWRVRDRFGSSESQFIVALLVLLVVMNLVSLTTPYVNDTSTVLVLSLLVGGAFGAAREYE